MTLKTTPQNQNTPKTYRSKIVTTPYRQYVRTYSNSLLRNYDETRKSYDKATEGQKLERSLQRTRENLKFTIETNTTQYTKFVTLTCRDQSNEREVLISRYKLFIKRLRYKMAKPIPYTYLMESHKSGALHIHAILYLDDYIPQRELQATWTHGIVDIRKLRDSRDTALYVMKYLTKDIIGSNLNKKAYINSPGLSKPLIEYSAEPIYLPNPDYSKQYTRTIENEQGEVFTTEVLLQEREVR